MAKQSPPTESSGRPGSSASTPLAMPRRGWIQILRRVWNAVNQDHVSVVAAGVAFFALLAVFPGIGVLVAIAGLVLEPAEVEQQLSSLMVAVPEDAALILQDQAKRVVAGSEGAISLGAVAGLLLTLYSASSGMRNLIEGMNIAYGEEEKRGFIKKALVAALLTVGVVVGFLVAVGLVIALPIVFQTIPLGGYAETMLALARWPILALVMIVGLAVVYRFGPSRSNPQWQWVSIGAVVATLIWIIGSVAFSAYVRNFASYNETYGSLGAAIILLMWLWLSAFAILLGAELNSELEHQTEKDTTVGSPKPMGQRGAVKADTRPTQP